VLTHISITIVIKQMVFIGAILTLALGVRRTPPVSPLANSVGDSEGNFIQAPQDS
jgi:hypothetical protein